MNNNYYSQKTFPWFKLLGGCALAGFSWLGLNLWQMSSAYRAGEKAYQYANCSEAIAEFDKVINNQNIPDLKEYIPRANAKKTECLAFQDAEKKQESGEWETALIDYNEFITDYPDSALNSTIREKSSSLFGQNSIPSVSNAIICEKLGELNQNQLIGYPETSMPILYQSCGEVYQQAKNYDKAAKMYETFLAQYPVHPQQKKVKESLASTLIAQAEQNGAGKIFAPGASGITVKGTTVVKIQNNSPSTLRLVFQGPETKIEDIIPCETCKEYHGQGPKTCPNYGTVENYTLKPGNYRVLVNVIDKNHVKPFVGEWNLNNGITYDNCFFIVQQPSTTF